MISLALIGNQNCGKTTLFNRLTGENRHVGNFPGVTVDGKTGRVRGAREAEVTDLPGIYSLRPYSNEEIVTRDFLLQTRPDGIINIVDATNVERNLYLTLQLLELRMPTVIALNMMDEVRNSGGTVNVKALSSMLGVPVIPISAAKNEGVEELIGEALRVARQRQLPRRIDFCPAGAVHRCIHAVSHLIEDHAARTDMPARFAATKVIEGDEDIIRRLQTDRNEQEMVEHAVAEMEEETGLDRHEALAAMRYDFIERVSAATVVKCQQSRERLRSERIDRILTNKYLALPLFLLIMLTIFILTFGVLGELLSNLLSLGIDTLCAQVQTGLTHLGVNPVIRSLVVEGILGGVGSVLSFIPQIVILFFFLSVLEDTGYMARVAFVMDKLLRKLGLSGRSFVPMLIGFGCTVPAVMSARTLSSERDRRMTVLLTPFMSCSAKMTIYLFFADAMLQDPIAKAGLVAALYVGGVAVGILVALVLNRVSFRGNPVPFVMELPNYRFPTAKSVAMLLWEKARDFIKKACTIILLASVIIWFLSHFDPRLFPTDDTAASLLGQLGGLLAVLFRPLGFGNFGAVTALISGFTAKEAVVSTLELLAPDGLSTLFPTVASQLSFLTFTLIYTPCVAAIAAIRSELGSRRAALGVVALQCGVAWLVSFAVYRCALLIPHLHPADWLILLAVLVAITAAAILCHRRRGGCACCAGRQNCPAANREERTTCQHGRR